MRATWSAVVSVLIAAALPAQLPEWVPFPVTNPTRTFLEAHIVVVQEPSAVHAYSTYIRRWATRPTSSPTAQFFGYDDHTVVQDGNTFYGYASRYGDFVPLVASSPTPFVISLAASSFLSVVVDGNQVHAFSPFTGQWSSLTTATTGAISAAKMAAVFSDGPRVYGYSPLYGQFVPLLAAANITAARAGGYCAHATDGVAHYAYSGVRNTWTTLPSAPGATVTVGTGRHGHLILVDGLVVDLFSGITGQSTRISCTQVPSVSRAEQIVVLQESVFTHLWSAITNTVGLHVAASPPAVTMQNYFALLQDGQTLHVFGAPTGTFAAPLPGAWNTLVSYNAALATNAQGATKAYSALRNQWVDGPTGTFMPTLTQGSVVLLDPAGSLHGYSVRTGTWSSTPTGLVDGTFTFGSNFCARAGNDLYAFNERYGRWSHTTTTSPATVRLHQQAIIADYGAAATAYSVWRDTWAPVQLSSPASYVGVSDESGLVQDSGGMHAYSASCQVSTWALYPEWWRFMSRGTPCPFHVAGEPGVGAFLALSFGTAAMTVPGITGELGVDLSSGVAMFGILPAEGMWVVPARVPNVPIYAGSTIHAQALVLAPAGPYFTSVYPTTIL